MTWREDYLKAGRRMVMELAAREALEPMNIDDFQMNRAQRNKHRASRYAEEEDLDPPRQLRKIVIKAGLEPATFLSCCRSILTR